MSWFFDLGTSLQSDTDRGRAAVTEFHQNSVRMPYYNEASVDSLLSKIMSGKSPEFFLEGLGTAIREIGMSQSQITDAMRSLAIRSNGRIPVQNEFFRALSDRVSQPTFTDYVGATPEVLGQSAIDVAHGAAEVGEAVLDVGKGLLQFGPILVLAAIFFIGFSRTKQLAGK